MHVPVSHLNPVFQQFCVFSIEDSFRPLEMPPCTCSIRALEVFVKDFAGASIKHGALRSLLQRRGLSNSAPLRQADTSTTTTPSSSANVVSGSWQRAGPLQKVQTKELNPGALEEAWDSNVEVDEAEPESANRVELVGIVEGIHDEFEAAEDVLLKSEEVAIAGMSRKSNRLQRKKRRQEDGSWKPVAKERWRVEQSKEYDEVVLSGDEAVEVADVSLRASGEAGGLKKRSKAPKESKTDRFKESPVAVAEKAVEIETSAPKTRRRRISEDVKSGKRRSQSDATKSTKMIAKKHTEPKSPLRRAKTSPAKVDIAANPTTQWRKRDREPWQIQKAALGRKFGEQGWQPNKRLSPDTLEGIRALHVSDPMNYNTETLAQHFHITPEAIRRILKSKWRPNEEEAEERRLRWEKRGVKKWSEMAELGIKPPAKWRALGVKTKEQEERRARGGRSRKTDEVLWDISDEAVGVGVGGESFAGRIL